MNYIIYLATNLVNNKKYIGQTTKERFEERQLEHLFDTFHLSNNVAFHNAIKKYGYENFKFEIIEENVSKQDIDSREQYWIAHYNTYIHAKNSNGYNETLGGQGTHGYIFTEADKQKMSIKQKQYWKNLKENNPTEYSRLCELRRQNKLGKKWDEQSRKKLSESCKGKIPWNKGKKGSQAGWNKGTSTLPPVLMIDKETGQVLNTFVNVYEAARCVFPEKVIRTTSTRIFSVCKADKGIAYGYVWRFKTNYLKGGDVNDFSKDQSEVSGENSQ